MAPSYSSIALILLLSICIPLQNGAVGDTDLIEKTCKASKYYDLCISSLSSNKTSQSADPKGLAIIMVRIGAANASSTNAYLSSLFQSISNAANGTVTMKKLIADCAKRYSYAVDALQASVQDLEDDGYDYAYMHVMAAADYPNVCRNNFRRAKVAAAAYPAELALREDALKCICQVVLGIIDSLGGGLM